MNKNILQSNDSYDRFFDLFKLLKRFNFRIVEDAPHMNNVDSLCSFAVENGFLTEDEAKSLSIILPQLSTPNDIRGNQA